MPSHPPTIAHVLHRLYLAGAEVLAAALARQMRDRFRFVFLCLDEIGPLGKQLADEGFTVIDLKRRPGVDLAVAKRIRAAVREHRIDLLHAHQYTPFFYASISRGPLGILTGKPRLLFTEHGRHYPDVRKFKRVIANKFLLGRRDRATAVGKFVKQALVNNEGMPAGRIEVVYNGIDTDLFRLDETGEVRAAVRCELGIGDDQPVVLQVARFHPVKDHATALRAFAAAVDQAAEQPREGEAPAEQPREGEAPAEPPAVGPAVPASDSSPSKGEAGRGSSAAMAAEQSHQQGVTRSDPPPTPPWKGGESRPPAPSPPPPLLLLAGDGERKGELESLAASLGIAGQVRFLGVRSDVPRLMAAADLFMLSSLSEGISVTLLEAMGAGVPIVATEVGGNSEVVAHNETGLLSPRSDAAALGANMRSLLLAPARRQSMGLAARQRLLATFTQTQMHHRYAEIYGEMTGRRA